MATLYPDTNPRPGDSKIAVLRKLSQAFGSPAAPDDGEVNLLVKILNAVNTFQAINNAPGPVGPPGAMGPMGQPGIMVPIGTVIAWMEDMGHTPNLPQEFVRCNGQMITDAASPYFGEDAPDINGSHAVLRGNLSSGTSGPSLQTLMGSVPTVNVVWIIRIK